MMEPVGDAGDGGGGEAGGRGDIAVGNIFLQKQYRFPAAGENFKFFKRAKITEEIQKFSVVFKRKHDFSQPFEFWCFPVGGHNYSSSIFDLVTCACRRIAANVPFDSGFE